MTTQFDRDPAFLRLPLQADAPNLLSLHKHVTRHRSRAELIDADGTSSVLITKCELESLEAALEMFGRTDEAREMHIHVARLAAASRQMA